MRALLLALALAATSLAILCNIPRNAKSADSPDEQTTLDIGSSAHTKSSLVFLGHAYPLNGFDKRKLKHYQGWIPETQPVEAKAGTPIVQRVLNNSDPALVRSSFYDPLSALSPDRWVWGGDSIYLVNKQTKEYFYDLVQSYQQVPQVFLPGNHDFNLINTRHTSTYFQKMPGEEEILAGIRMLYVDTVTENGALMARGKGYSAPSEQWISDFKTRINNQQGERGLIIMMHHAPWFLGKPQANVTHKDSPWWNQVHPILQNQVAEGQAVVVVSGDGGRPCMADGQIIDGVRYCVTGQPAHDGSSPNGFLRFSWKEQVEGIQVDVFTWTVAGGLEEHTSPPFPWRF